MSSKSDDDTECISRPQDGRRRRCDDGEEWEMSTECVVRLPVGRRWTMTVKNESYEMNVSYVFHLRDVGR